MKKIRVVVIFTDNTQMPCDIMSDNPPGLTNLLNTFYGDFIECRNATLNGKQIDTFILYKNSLRGIVPIE